MQELNFRCTKYQANKKITLDKAYRKPNLTEAEIYRQEKYAHCSKDHNRHNIKHT